jgi:hypothetical protein
MNGTARNRPGTAALSREPVSGGNRSRNHSRHPCKHERNRDRNRWEPPDGAKRELHPPPLREGWVPEHTRDAKEPAR